MAELFRKSSLEKLSSPEQLDKMIVITPPSFWMALAGAGIIIAGALAWSVFGRLPVNVETQGIYVNNGGVYSVYSETTGIVERLAVHEGDEIRKGDVVAYLSTDDLEQKLIDYDTRIANIEVITMDSKEDVVTADNKGLIEIKGQMLTIDQNLYQDQKLLEMYSDDVAEQRRIADEAERKMQEAEAAYYNSLNLGDSTSEQLAYTEAQNDLANASAYLETANGNLDQANVALIRVRSEYQSLQEQYNKIEAQEKALGDETGRKWEALAAAAEGLGFSGITPDDLDSYTGQGFDDEIEEYRSALETYNEYCETVQSAKEEMKNSLEQSRQEVEAAESTKNNYQNDVEQYSGRKEDAAAEYEGAKGSYLNRIAALGAAQSAQTQLSNTYSMALNTYNTEQSKLDNLLDSLTRTEVQVDSDRRIADEQTETIYSQFAATKAASIDQLRLEAEQYREQLAKCEIIATVSGRVTDIAVVQGSAVNQGSELLKVQQDEGEENVIVCYVPLGSGKKITEGMEVLVYPSTVNKQEYGHMTGTVLSVDPYVASTEELRTKLGNESLVEAFLKDGPVVAVVCRLQEASDSVSGYYWSSAKGKEVALAEGTMVEASIVLEEKAPITMLIPYIKEKLTIKTEDSDQ